MKILIAFLLIGCASHHKTASNPNYHNSSSYQARDTLDNSFVAKGKHNMSEEQIKILLNSKIVKPKNVRLTIIKLRGWGIDTNFFDEDNGSENKSFLMDLVKESRRIDDIAIIPSFLVPSEMTISNLRDVSALMQSNYMLIIKSNSYSDHKIRLFKANEYLVTAQLEVALMDVKTGVIPYTAMVTGKSKYKKLEKDFNESDFRARAEKKALSAAYKKIQLDIMTYFK